MGAFASTCRSNPLLPVDWVLRTGRPKRNKPDFRQGLPFLFNFCNEPFRYYRHARKNPHVHYSERSS